MCKSHWSMKYRSRSRVKVPANSVHQGEAQCMVDVGLIVEELSNINAKCVKYRSRYLPSQCNEVKHYARFSGCRSYI